MQRPIQKPQMNSDQTRSNSQMLNTKAFVIPVQFKVSKKVIEELKGEDCY